MNCWTYMKNTYTHIPTNMSELESQKYNTSPPYSFKSGIFVEVISWVWTFSQKNGLLAEAGDPRLKVMLVMIRTKGLMWRWRPLGLLWATQWMAIDVFFSPSLWVTKLGKALIKGNSPFICCFMPQLCCASDLVVLVGLKQKECRPPQGSPAKELAIWRRTSLFRVQYWLLNKISLMNEVSNSIYHH